MILIGNAYVPRHGRVTNPLDGMCSPLIGEDTLVYLLQATMGITVTAARPQTPPVPATPENVLISAQATGADIIFCVPSFIEVGLAMTPDLSDAYTLYRPGPATVQQLNT